VVHRHRCSSSSAFPPSLTLELTGIISTALDLISGEFSITEDTIKGLITSSILVGALVGSLVAGVAADKFGRRVTTIIGSGICSFAALAQGTPPLRCLLLVPCHQLC